MSVPVLRFKQDDGGDFPEWEEKRLADVGENIIGLTYSPSNVTDDKSFPIVLRSSNIKNDMLDLNDQVRVKEKISGKLFTQENDILICTRNGSQRLIGKNVLISDVKIPMTFGAFMSVFRSPLNRFIVHLFKTENYNEQIQMNLGARINQITTKNLNAFIFNFPSEPEQTKIANFLTAIDEKITQLTQKHDLLTQYKRGVTQQIFSQELRFKDDDGGNFPEWEEKSLKQLIDIVIDNRGKTPPVQSFGYPLIEVNAIGNKEIKYIVVTKYVSDETYKGWFRKHIKDGDVLFSTVGATALCSYFKDESLKATIAQNIVGLRFKQPYSGLFMFYMLTEKNNNQKFKTIEMGAVQPSVKVSQMIHLLFNIPSPEEQTKIANFLTAIDDKITATQSQLQAVKQYKQGLLQQMFV